MYSFFNPSGKLSFGYICLGYVGDVWVLVCYMLFYSL